jgi:hypothetical protein
VCRFAGEELLGGVLYQKKQNSMETKKLSSRQPSLMMGLRSYIFWKKRENSAVYEEILDESLQKNKKNSDLLADFLIK